MVSERLDPAWLDPGLQDKIKARLHRSFDVFEGRVKDIESVIDELIEKLDLEPGGKVKWQEASVIVREFKRATFTLERSEYEELLETIKEGVSSVESMVDRNIKMEPERKRRSQGRLIRIAREVSGSVYRALVSSLQCSCSHRLHLGLASRSVDIPHGEADDGVIQRLSFRLAVTFETIDKESINANVSWEEVLVRALPKETICSVTPSGSNPQVTGVKKKLVSFAVTQSSSNTPTGVAQRTATMVVQKTVSSSSPGVGNSMAKLDEHINLCASIRRSQKQKALDCYGMIRDRTPQAPRDFYVYPKQSSSSDGQTWSIVSLREVLERPLLYPHMSYTAKLHLAAMISSSFLQLHQTPWLPDDLCSSNILFLKKGVDVDYEHAFVLRRQPEGGHKASSKANVRTSSTLRSLGILLLELRLGGTLESFRIPYEKSVGDERNPTYDSMVVDRLLDRNDKVGENYALAVRCCVWGDFGRQIDLDNDDFREEMYEKVVALLESDLSRATWSSGERRE
ncbi:hypothetical protein CMUS01_14972 [Colletotrichum musicola]|uniref:DUF7580 domain-containing protein n=1 Tax=Colletotrichum musicola TaxID=2175873 RepID=A0A8H6J0Q8_9PEZI|nr:hypothetical protein CMUS01_14972 [Colletotrichum musicola]